MWGVTCVEIRLQVLHIRLLPPANSSHLRSLRSATVRETNLHPSCRSAWHLQTAQSVNNNQTHKRNEFQSTYIGLCLPIAVLQCDPATQRSSNAHLGVAAQLPVTHTITQGSIIPVQSAISSAASAGVHVPGASLAVIQPTESAYLGGCSVAAAGTCIQSFRGVVVV